MLRESEERLRVALNTGRLGAWEMNLNTNQLETTAICNLNLGLPADAVLSPDEFYATICEVDRDAFVQTVQQSIESLSDYETEYRCQWPDGSVHWIIGRGRPICDSQGKPIRMLGVNLDITDRRRVEEERTTLLDSERAAGSKPNVLHA